MKTILILILVVLCSISCVNPYQNEFLPPIETVLVVKFKQPEYKDYILVNSIALNKGDSIGFYEENTDFILPPSVVNLYGRSPYIELSNNYLLVDWKWYGLIMTSQQAIVSSLWTELTNLHKKWSLTDIYEKMPIESYCVIPIGSIELRSDKKLDWVDMETFCCDVITEKDWEEYSDEQKAEIKNLISFNNNAYAEYAKVLNLIIEEGDMEMFRTNK